MISAKETLTGQLSSTSIKGHINSSSSIKGHINSTSNIKGQVNNSIINYLIIG